MAAALAVASSLTLGLARAAAEGAIVIFIDRQVSVREGDPERVLRGGRTVGGPNTAEVRMRASRPEGFWDVYVDYRTADGTAKALTDYYPVPDGSKTVGFPHAWSGGYKGTNAASVQTVVDILPEADKTFSVYFSNLRFCVNYPSCRPPSADEAVLGAVRAVVTIVDDDRSKPGRLLVNGVRVSGRANVLFVTVDSGPGKLTAVEAGGRAPAFRPASARATKNGKVAIPLTLTAAAHQLPRDEYGFATVKVTVTYKPPLGRIGRQTTAVRLYVR